MGRRVKFKQDYGDELLVKAVSIISLNDIKAANILRQCSISVEVDLEKDNNGVLEVISQHIAITAPETVTFEVDEVLLQIKAVFRYLFDLESIESGSIKFIQASSELAFVDLGPVTGTPPKEEFNFIDVLQLQQQDFVERLKQSPSSLLKCNTVGNHSESIVISSESTERLRKFCWEMANKFKGSSQSPYETFISTMKGKLGEEALVNLLGDYVTEVDYGVKRGGDGKVDFKLSSCPNIGIQVKARNGSVDRLSWYIDSKELEANSVLVCFLIQEKVDVAQPEYHIIAAGFIPTATIDQTKLLENGNKTATFKIDELRYMGGLRSYLEFLKKKEDLKFKKECINLSSPHFNFEQAWEEVVGYAPRTIGALFKQQGYLIAFDGKQARVVFTNRGFLAMAEKGIPHIEAAFADIYGYAVKVSLEVMSPGLLLEKGISLKN